MKLIFAALLLIVPVLASADTRKVTLYTDGALHEFEQGAVRGNVDIPLPAALVEGSLRVAPLGQGTIERVELVPSRLEAKAEKELDQLQEQKNRLEDRLRALDTREEIFKSAAKSQSGKAPRKSKTNPDPMQTIRQGTDFAIAQLESVYTTRRKTEHELRRIEARIATLKKGAFGGSSVARVRVSPANGRVQVRYATTGNGWVPRYDIRVGSGDIARVTLYGLANDAFSSSQLLLSPGSLTDSEASVMSGVSGAPTRLKVLELPISAPDFRDGIRAAYAFTLTNTGQTYLPAGPAALYRNGEYRGHLRFSGISSGRKATLKTAGQ